MVTTQQRQEKSLMKEIIFICGGDPDILDFLLKKPPE
jgi:hypothetical protein